jgi:hypothetical protein
MTRRETAQRAISKALELRPVVIQVDHDFWAVQGSQPGHGYLIERDPESGDLWCPCRAAEMTGTCYHRASVGLAIGTVPQAWMPAGVSSVAVAS